MLRFGLYARKSDDDRSVTEKSIGEQVAACQNVAYAHDLIILKQVEESKSAMVPGIRPLWTELVASIEAGEIDAILCWHINRLVRNMKEGGELVQLLVDKKIKEIRTPHGVYHPEDNILPIVIEAASATQYSRDLSNTVKRSMIGNFDRGNCNHRAPQGYRNARNEVNLKRGIILKDEDRFEKIRIAWDMMLTGRHSVKEILEYLNETLGYRTRLTKEGGGTPLSATALYGMFRNPFYTGMVRYDGKITQGHHEAMVTGDEFALVQTLLAKDSFDAPHVLEHSFTGLMRCKHCGYQITADRKKISTGKLWTSYRCSDSKLKCTKKGIEGTIVNRKVAACIRSIRIDKRYVTIALENISEELKFMEVDSATRESVDAQIKDVSERIRNLEEMGLSGLIRDPKRYRELQDQELAKKQALLIERERVLTELTRMKINAERALTYAAFADESFIKASPSQKGALAGILAESYLFDGITKHIDVTIKPILKEIVRFVKEEIQSIEPSVFRSESKKELAFATSFSLGGPKARLIALPEPLLKELRGPLFPEFPMPLEEVKPTDWARK